MTLPVFSAAAARFMPPHRGRAVTATCFELGSIHLTGFFTFFFFFGDAAGKKKIKRATE